MAKRALFFCLPGILLLTALTVSGGASGEMDLLRRDFLHPPASARPWVYWFWIDGNVTRAGITADLEAMQRAGIGGLILMDVTQDIPAGPVAFDSPEWHNLFTHAANEAARLGLEISVHNAAGFTGSGGPWITPELAMQKLISARTNLVGPMGFHGPLARLPNEVSSHPVATLAFPALLGEGARDRAFTPVISSSGNTSLSVSNLLDGNTNTFVTLPAPTLKRPVYLQMEFPKPFTASLLKLTGYGGHQPVEGFLEISDDGRSFRKVREFMSARPDLSLGFEQVSARWFRVVFTGAISGINKLRFSEIELSPQYPIPSFQTRAGLGPLPAGAEKQDGLPTVPPEAIIKPGSVIDLTSGTDRAGNLNWDVPPGIWTVLRLGYAPVGTLNHPARPGGEGLESDKLSREATDAHFAGFAAKLLGEVDQAGRKALTGLHIDSWEVGYQNWSPHFLEEFSRRRGYDPLPFLPALTGRYVAAPEQSERFLWDIRQTIADLVADNYAAELQHLAARAGLKLSVEGYASLGAGPFNTLAYGARADLPMAEFWLEGTEYSKVDLHAMPSAAHTSGKEIVPAEAFTSYPAGSGWREHPFALKALGDVAFCEGINRLVMHRYAHQPWLDRRPGMTMGSLGLHYERTQTWWEQSKAWHAYLSRCQFLLQEGLFVADVCYLLPEGAYTKATPRSALDPALPEGYHYDLIAPEVLGEKMSARNGRLCLPDGMGYAALVLPKATRMTPGLLKKLKALVEAGATIVGAPPHKSPSLSDYPQCDAEVTNLAAALWGKCDGRTCTENRLGKGKVIWGRPLEAVLAEAGAPPDLTFRHTAPGPSLRWIHRRMGGADIFFVANPNPQPAFMEGRFRAADKTPEFWHPDNGRIEQPAVWRREAESTIVPLKIDPGGSLFVVFSATNAVDPVSSITRNGRDDTEALLVFDEEGKLQLQAGRSGNYRAHTASGKTYAATVEALPSPMPITGRWELGFPANSGAPAHVTFEALRSWSTDEDPGVRFFSGTATYTKRISLPPDIFGRGRKLSLNLGSVRVIAELKMNGRDLGILWKPPFEADITEVAHAGENQLEIKVTNLWPNRMIGDEQLAPDRKWRESPGGDTLIAEWPQWLLEGKPSPTGRQTLTTWKYWSKDSPLLESGLLGPVTIRVVEQQALR